MRMTCLVPNGRFDALREELAPLGIECTAAVDAFALLRRLDRAQTDVVLVDVGWNAELEENLVAWIECRAGHVLPIVLQTASNDPQTIARWLEAGAADVVSRGCDRSELAARLQAAARRHRCVPPQRGITLAGFELDRVSQRVCWNGCDLNLTPREFSLAWLLFSRPGSCLRRGVISAAVWGKQEEISSRTIEQHVHRLRKKMRVCVSCGVNVRAAYGIGYRLSVTRDAQEAAADGQGSVPADIADPPMRSVLASLPKAVTELPQRRP